MILKKLKYLNLSTLKYSKKDMPHVLWTNCFTKFKYLKYIYNFFVFINFLDENNFQFMSFPLSINNRLYEKYYNYTKAVISSSY